MSKHTDDITQLRNAVDEARLRVKNKNKEIDDYEIDVDKKEVIESYESMLDDAGDVSIAGYKFAPSYALKQLDEIAYNEGMNNYVDGMDKEEFDDYNDLVDELDELENELADAEAALDEAEASEEEETHE